MNIDKIESKVNQIENKYNEKTKNIENKINLMENDLDRQTYTIFIAGYSTTKYALKGTIKGVKAKRKGEKFTEEFKKYFNEDAIEEDVDKKLEKLAKLKKTQNPVNVARRPLNIIKKVINLIKKITNKKDKPKSLAEPKELSKSEFENQRNDFIEQVKIGDDIKENIIKTAQEHNNSMEKQIEEKIEYGKE